MTVRSPSALALLAGAEPYAAVLEDLRARSRRWLVTGGAGFIGSHMTQALLELGQEVIVLDDLSSGRLANLHAVRRAVGADQVRLRFVRGDVRDLETLAFAAEDVDVVLHHAARVSVPGSLEAPFETHDVNVTGFLRVLEVARERRARVVYAASSASYGDDAAPRKQEDHLGRPLSMYAASKTADEAYAAAYHAGYGLRTVGLRYFNVFGDRQDPNGAYAAVIPVWIAAKARGRPCRIHGDGSTTRDFCHVANVVGAVLLASQCDDPRLLGAVANVGTGTPTTLLELHAAIDSAVGARRPERADGPLEFGPFRPGDVQHSCADVERARAWLGYRPVVDLAAGIGATVDAFLLPAERLPRRMRRPAPTPHAHLWRS